MYHIKILIFEKKIIYIIAQFFIFSREGMHPNPLAKRAIVKYPYLNIETNFV